MGLSIMDSLVLIDHCQSLIANCSFYFPPLLKDIENLFDLFASAEGGRKKFDLSESKHLPPKSRIFQKISCLQFESEDEA